MKPPHFPRVGGLCKESRNETVVHRVYSPPMHDGNAPVEWEGKLEDITWDMIPLGVNYLSSVTFAFS